LSVGWVFFFYAAHRRKLGSVRPGIYLNPIRGDIHTVLLNKKKFVATIAFCLAAIPVWAGHVDSIDWSVSKPLTIGTTQVQPGEYQLKAEEGKSEIQVLTKGKVIATVPCHWTQLPTKAENAQIATDGTKVTQVQFAGRTSVIQID
jgi:hypothetical protein